MGFLLTCGLADSVTCRIAKPVRLKNRSDPLPFWVERLVLSFILGGFWAVEALGLYALSRWALGLSSVSPNGALTIATYVPIWTATTVLVTFAAKGSWPRGDASHTLPINR